jgi:iron complex transport system ATP-binding protein
MLEAKNISFNVGKKVILRDISTSFLPGKLTVILGPNGSGKSSLIKLLSGSIKKYTGGILIKNKDIVSFSDLELAKFRSVLLQNIEVSLPFKVQEIIMLGRYPYIKKQTTARDNKICLSALETCGVSHLKHAMYANLSGGEKQRVQFARVLAQIGYDNEETAKILFLDEPTNSLDIKHQISLLDIAKDFAKKGNTVVAVLHDLNLAMDYAEHIIFLKEGRKIAEGKKEEVMTESFLKEIYETDIEIFEDKITNKKFIKYN